MLDLLRRLSLHLKESQFSRLGSTCLYIFLIFCATPGKKCSSLYFVAFAKHIVAKSFIFIVKYYKCYNYHMWRQAIFQCLLYLCILQLFSFKLDVEKANTVIVNCRGRYSVELHLSFLRLQGQATDFKIQYSSVVRLFLLPKVCISLWNNHFSPLLYCLPGQAGGLQCCVWPSWRSAVLFLLELYSFWLQQ